MDAVGAQPLRQRHVVVDDEGGAVRGADRPERFGPPRRFMLVDALDPKLKGRDRRGRQRLFEPRGTIAADSERGNPAKLATGERKSVVEGERGCVRVGTG